MDTDTISLTHQGEVASFYSAKMGRMPNPSEGEFALREELMELLEALQTKESDAHTIKEMADSLYTIYGYAAARGWDMDGAFAAVHRSNLTKEVTLNATIGTKVRKGAAYVEPDMEPYLGLV